MIKQFIIKDVLNKTRMDKLRTKYFDCLSKNDQNLINCIVNPNQDIYNDLHIESNDSTNLNGFSTYES